MGRKTKKNVVTSAELILQVNQKNIQLMNDFLNYLRSVQRSETTIKSYENDILIAMVWCLKHNDNKYFIDWTKRNVVAYQNWLINNNENSPARVRRLKASLSSMSNYICNVLDDEYPTFKNIINKIESPVNQPVRDKTILTDEQIEILLDELAKQNRYDIACAVALAWCSGRRKAELPRFKISDFNEDKLVCDGALYKSSPIKTKGRGVQGKPLECFCLAKKFKPHLDNWMKQRADNGIESEWLFPSKEDMSKPASIATFNSWAKKISRILGVDFYWHAMRHMTVTSFKRAGIPDTVIQQYIGWTDISMVPVYVDMQADEQLGMYFGEDGIKTPQQRSIGDL